MNPLHKEILDQIQLHSGKPTQHTFLDSYLGNNHPRYSISIPILRKIAKEWMSSHRSLSVLKFAALLTSLNKGDSSTEKTLVGILLDYSTLEQRKFDPRLFDRWLNYLQGWAEVDSLCTGRYSDSEILSQWKTWRPQLIKFSKSKNIHKRRASLVLLCSPLRKSDDPRLARMALQNTHLLKSEKEILITKAISWVLRTLAKHHRTTLLQFMNHESGLPTIAVRETWRVLETGRKTSRK
jgi:3-methyladenine DNA glycosylase AlkD